jgi:hypothetical protein
VARQTSPTLIFGLRWEMLTLTLGMSQMRVVYNGGFGPMVFLVSHGICLPSSMRAYVCVLTVYDISG